MSDIFGETSSAVLAAPDGIDQKKFNRRNDGDPQQKSACKREQDIGRRIEQACAQEADKAGHLDRRHPLGNEFLSNE